MSKDMRGILRMILKEKTNTEINRYDLQLEVTPEEFNEAVNAVYKKESKKMNVPGFRKGKAPRGFIEKYYGEQVFFESAVDHLYRSMVTFAIDESELEVVSVSKFDIEDIGKDIGLNCKIGVVTKPEVSVSDYQGIEVYTKPIEVTDDEVSEEIERVRERNSRIIAVEDRAVKDGDITVIDFDGYVDDEQFDGGKAENHELTIGSGQFIPGFEEQVIGHNIDDEFDVNVKFPDDYHAEELKGKDAVFKVKLHEVKMKELPEVDDEFVKDVSEFDTLDQYKEDIKKNIEHRKEHEKEHEIENQIIEAIIGKTEGDIPEEMISNEVDEMINSFAYRLQSQGMNLETYFQYTGMNADMMREQYKPQAEKQVTIRLALEKIAEYEKVEPSEDEVTEEYEKLAKTYEMPLENVKNMVSEKSLKADISNQKVMKFLQEKAIIKEGEKPESKTDEEKSEE